MIANSFDQKKRNTNEHKNENDTEKDRQKDKTTQVNLHPKLEKIMARFPPSLSQLKNIIFYGPNGVGKYTQMLNAIRRYSMSNLKYERKINVTFNKQSYFFKVSDIHYEIDMALLGCNSKLLWHEIYQQIVDIIATKPDKSGIIVCKNFHEIHSELLDNFYSYMQKNITSPIHVIFILLTRELSFINENILNCCETIHMNRPTKAQYSKCCKHKLPPKLPLEAISNIKMLHSPNNDFVIPHVLICNKILAQLVHIQSIHFLQFRDILYDIFIYNLDLSECVYYILSVLIQQGKLQRDQMSVVLVKTYSLFQYYNNNYRPIYHVENYFYNLAKIIHGF